jgi:PIN domain nuclease of toxin-antitoxin system
VRFLVDAHVLIWAVDAQEKLSPGADTALRTVDNELLLSAGTIWEIALKVGLGKLRLTLPYRQWMERVVADLGVTVLPVTVAYAAVQASLPRHHGDPFDRLLVAQAQVERVPVVSNDPLFDQYGIDRVW